MIRLLLWWCSWVARSVKMIGLNEGWWIARALKVALRAGRQLLGPCVLSVLLATQLVHAQTDAYTVEVAVADRGADEQQDAYEVAFRRVLLDNSGDKTLLNRDDIRAGLGDAESYVASFSYRTPPAGTVVTSDTPITALVRETGEATQLMLISFDRNRVRELIDSANRTGQPIASSAVPAASSDTALVWLLIQDNGRDILIADPEARNIQLRAREIAGAAGKSLVFPVGDEADREALNVNDMLAQDIQRFQAASVRYEQETILIGSLRRNGASGWRGQWVRLAGDAVRQDATFDTVSLDVALQEGLALLIAEGNVDEAYRYGGSAASDTEGLIWVGSLGSLNDYVSVLDFLQTNPAVATVYPKEVSDTAMVFAVLPRSALRDIETAVLSQGWLRRVAPPISSVQNSLAGNADLALDFNR